MGEKPLYDINDLNDIPVSTHIYVRITNTPLPLFLSFSVYIYIGLQEFKCSSLYLPTYIFYMHHIHYIWSEH